MRLHYYLGVILEDENEGQECFRIIQSEVLEATIKSLAYNEQARIVTDHHKCGSTERRAEGIRDLKQGNLLCKQTDLITKRT